MKPRSKHWPWQWPGAGAGHRLGYHFWRRKLKPGSGPMLTFVILFAFVHSLSQCFAIKTQQQQPQIVPNGEKRELIKSLVDELRDHELHHIFGKSRHQNPQDAVPNNLDLISPVLISHSHRKIKRRKGQSGHEEQSATTASVKLRGLERVFTLSLRPNRALVSTEEFVHLVRRDNYSDILPDDLVRSRLDCFYHGHVHHSEDDGVQGLDEVQEPEFEQKQGKEVKSGRVALDLCKGVSGFIVPSDNDPEHFYVIHPVPARLHRHKSMGDRHNPHFLWQQQQEHKQDEFMTAKAKPSFKRPASTRRQKDNRRVTSGLDSRTASASASATCAHEVHLRQDNDNDDDAAAADFLTAAAAAQQSEDEDGDGDDNDSDGDAGLGTAGHGDRRGNRARRSPRPHPSPRPSSYIDDGQFHYKPLSIASDSYWLRYRTTASPSSPTPHVSASADVNNEYRDRDYDSSVTLSSPYGGSRRRGSGRRARNSAEDSSSWSNRDVTVGHGNDWAKGVLVYESSRVVPSATEPYHTASTGTRKYSSVIPSSSLGSLSGYPRRGVGVDDDAEEDGLGRRRPASNWVAGSSSSRKFDIDEPSRTVSGSSSSSNIYRYGNDSLYDFKSQSRWTSPSSSSFTMPSGSSSSSSRYRKGRRDDSIFGDKWYTSLDYTSAERERLDPLASAPSIVSSERILPPSDSVHENSIHGHGHGHGHVRGGHTHGHIDKEPSHLTIETAVFIDKDLFKHMQANFPEDTHGEVARIVLAMINAVQLLYQDPSLGHRVDFVLKRLEILESDPAGLLRPLDIDQFLTNFCKWQKLENPPNDAHFLHWDHALILTGLDLYVVHQSGKISNQVVGLAPVSGMCTRSSSCTVNEGRHFESVYVVAHEIGHNLGMRHDGVQADNDCDPTAHIMSPTLGSGKISWSPCSKRYLDMFLETSQSKCLLDKAKSESRLDHESDGRLPGERFNSDKQCVLKYGRGSFHAEQQPIEDVCRDLHCRKEHYTWTSHPALEGTFCGKELWCRGGKCVPKLTNLLSSTEHTGNVGPGSGHGHSAQDSFFGHSEHHNHLDRSETAAYSASRPIEGGWGKWSPFTDCSSACLYTDDGLPSGSTGIRLAARRCDSPRPENGGLQCFGSDRRYKTCNTDKICPFESSKTTVTQYANEVCIRAATVDTELSGRGFMTSTNDPERACSVWCETTQRSGSRSRGWSFPDGTACTLSSKPEAHSFCIAGKCQDFGCDSSTHFALADEICVSGGARHGRISAAGSGSNSDYSIPKTWFHTSVSSSSISASSSVSSGGNGARGRGFGGDNHENEIFGWTRWETHSDCKLSCLEPAKGLELVQRHCKIGENHCKGVALSVRLCKPNKTTIVANGCTRIQTPFEYATKICGKYSRKISGLSGLGMQLSPTKEDVDRPCRIGCQDVHLPYRFYMVNGEEGWFPSGTDCSRGDPGKKAFCLSGKCVEFGQDDTPNYRMNSAEAATKLPLNLQSESGRHFRQRRGTHTHAQVQAPIRHQHLRHSSSSSRRAARTAPWRGQSWLDQNSLRELVAQFSQGRHKPGVGTGAHGSASARNATESNLDFNRPVEMLPNTNNAHGGPPPSMELQPDQLQPLEGSFYEWRKVMSDCSVTCGSGIQEVIVQCVSGDTIVNDSLCPSRTRPGYSSYVPCTAVLPKCPGTSSSRTNSTSTSALPSPLNATFLWNWLEAMRLSSSRDSDKESESVFAEVV